MLNLITTEAEVVVAAQKFINSDCKFLGAAFEFGLTPVEFKVYFYLTQIADCNLRASQSVKKLANACKIRSLNTVKRVIDSLVAMAIVRRPPMHKSTEEISKKSPSAAISFRL